MKYTDFPKGQQQYINGVLSQHMDAYIRKHKIWTPEQMYEDLMEKKLINHKKGWFGPKRSINGVLTLTSEVSERWIVSVDARDFILERFTKKYEKNRKLAKKNGPMEDRIRFGKIWEDGLYFDINYGLQKGSHNYAKTEIVEGSDLIPWTIEHVDEQLAGYDTDLPTVLSKLSTSYIEKNFYKYWLDNYYHDRTQPALIPEFCGNRSTFYVKRKNDNYYMSTSDIADNQKFNYSLIKGVNIRFDFLIINWYKQKKMVIELDGHAYHKTVKQRNKDAIKRTVASNNDYLLNVITSQQIEENIEACFRRIDDFLSQG